MQIKCPAAGQDGITGTRFRLPPETTKKPDKTFKACQAVKGGEPYEAQLTVWRRFPGPVQAERISRWPGGGDSSVPKNPRELESARLQGGGGVQTGDWKPHVEV